MYEKQIKKNHCVVWWNVRSFQKIHLKTIYILALFPTGSSLFTTLKSSCLVLFSPLVLSPIFPFLKIVVLRNFPPLDLGESSIVQIDVQWRFWHPYGEHSPTHVLRGIIFNEGQFYSKHPVNSVLTKVNFSGDSLLHLSLRWWVWKQRCFGRWDWHQIWFPTIYG